MYYFTMANTAYGHFVRFTPSLVNLYFILRRSCFPGNESLYIIIATNFSSFFSISSLVAFTSFLYETRLVPCDHKVKEKYIQPWPTQ